MKRLWHKRAVAILGVVALLSLCNSASADILIGGSIAEGNGDFNYEGGAVGILDTLTVTENIPRDRAFVTTPTSTNGIDIDGWTLIRVAYNGGNNAFGLDGNFGFDDASFEAANTGSGQAFQNGNDNSVVDLIADQISHTGSLGDVFDLSYLVGSDSAGAGGALVTLTLDANLASEQVVNFGAQSRFGTSRAGANTVAEQYVSTGEYTTVDLQLRMQNSGGSTRTLIDDVRLDVTSAIPEPATAVLLGGIAGFAMLRRRRN